VPDPVHVTTAAALDDLVAILVDQPRYALDTEFHRERTYYPKVALVQVAWDGGIALIDPLAVSLGRSPGTGPGLAVLHVPQTEVLDLACGRCRHDAPSSLPLLRDVTVARLARGSRLKVQLPRATASPTGWPSLTDDQLTYAAADVATARAATAWWTG
jgi:hypothetical protein